MKQFESNTGTPLVDTAPIFASVWLALFNEIRKSYSERHPANSSYSEAPEVMEREQSSKHDRMV